MPKSRILLTGCHGLLGQRIVQGIGKTDFILGVDIHDKSFIHGENFQYAHLDITNRRDVKRVCEEFRPDWIVNTAAFTNVDECETKKEHCWKINVESVENLIKYAKRIEAKFIHFSSDYIYDGAKKMYSELDIAAPLNYYGRAKLASENIVKASGIHWALMRTSTLYDIDTLTGRDNFVTWVIRNLQKGNSIPVATDQWGNPTLARNLAEAVWKVVRSNVTGEFQAAGKEIVDRHSFAKKIASMFDLNEWLVHPVSTEELGQCAVRPLKIGLDVTKIENMLDLRMMDVEEGLTVFKNEYVAIHSNN